MGSFWVKTVLEVTLEGPQRNVWFQRINIIRIETALDTVFNGVKAFFTFICKIDQFQSLIF